MLIKIIRRLIDHHLHHLICSLSLSLPLDLSAPVFFSSLSNHQISSDFSSLLISNKQTNKQTFCVFGSLFWRGDLIFQIEPFNFFDEMSTGDLLNIDPLELKFPCQFLLLFLFSSRISFLFFLLFFGFSRFLVLFFVWRLFMVFNCSRF